LSIIDKHGMVNVGWWLSDMTEPGMHLVGTLEKRRSVEVEVGQGKELE
jgi:hypothetical protein